MNVRKYDNHVQRLIEELFAKRGKYDPSIVKTADHLLKEAKKIQDDALLGFTYYYLAEAYYTFSLDHDKFKSVLVKAMEHLQLASEFSLLGKCYNLLGIDALLHGTMSLGMDYLMTALRYCNSNDESNLRGVVNSNIGHIYADLGDYTEALHYLKDAIADIQRYPDDQMYFRDMLLCYTMEGNYYLKQNRHLEKARSCLKKACRIWEKFPQPKDVNDELLLSVLQIKVLHYSELFQERDAEIRNLLNLLKGFHGYADLVEDICDIGLFLLEIGDLESTRKLLQLTEPSLSSLNVPSIEIQITQFKIEYYTQAGLEKKRLESADLYYKLSMQLKLSEAVSYKFSIDIRRSMEEMRASQEKIQQENLRLIRQAEYDQLTGLPNRYHLNRFSDQAFDRAFQNQTSLAVEILDIDYFKEYNDTYGHQAGDVCLQQISEQIRLLTQSHANVYSARYGGDEFVIIYEGMADDEVTSLAASLRNRIHDLSIPHQGSKSSSCVTVSQGIRNSIPKEENKLWDYMYTADNALYSVKQHTKGEIVLLHSAVISQKSLADAMRT
ncbi:MAG: GGDEF domain-containing protein [Butyrivibrio sp.]|nr:GGDEF domain-containing protein [Butyrivibrio sp.]